MELCRSHCRGHPNRRDQFQTMEFKVVLGLYVGEILDSDGRISGFNFHGCGRRDYPLVERVPQVSVQMARLSDVHPVSLNAASALNLRFLDREEEIIYPWTREGLACRQV